MTTLRVKICGITQADQGAAIAQMGASALGFICVPDSPRYIPPKQIRAIAEPLPPAVARVGVFVNADLDTIKDVASIAGLTAIQLHGDESKDFCQRLRDRLPTMKLIKAMQLHSVDAQTMTQPYLDVVDTLLLDAYHPTLRGGTGHALNWDALRHFHPPIPWFLAGGINPNNVLEALGTLSPNGIDLSSGVERAPGDKAIDQVALLFSRLTLHGYQCRRGK